MRPSETSLGTIDRMILVVNQRCNSRCVACKRWEHHDPQELNIDSIDGLLRRSKYLGKLKRINISGGEPFLYSHLSDLLYLIREIYGRDLLISCITNGLNPSKIVPIAERHAPFGNLQLFVSIDGARIETHENMRGVRGSFQLAWATLEGLTAVQRKIPSFNTGISMTLTVLNWHEVGEVFSQSRALGVGFTTRLAMFTSVYYRNRLEKGNLGISVDDLEALQRELSAMVGNSEGFSPSIREFLHNLVPGSTQKRDYVCHAGLKSCCVQNSGRVTPCMFVDQSIGNINSSSFDRIWSSEQANFCRDWVSRRICGCWNDCETVSNIEYNKAGVSEKAGW